MFEQYGQMFKLIKASLFSGEDEDFELENTEEIFKEMKAQSVTVLPYDWLKKNKKDEYENWIKFCALQQGRWVWLMYCQDKLIKLLEDNGIPCVIIKGASSSSYYPKPSFRLMGDVDFLVKRENFEKTAQLLENNGYSLTADKKESFHHYAYSKDDVHFELHRRLGIVREDDDKMISLFENGIDNRVFKTVEGFTFPSLPDELNALVLIFHINQHLRSGLGLRQIIDWMVFVNNLSDDILKEKVLPILRETGNEKLALTVTATCQKYLGLRTIVEDIDKYPCDGLMDLIIENGNFGRKAGTEGKIASFAFTSTDKGSFFKRLQNGGLGNWKAAKKHKILRPFAWIYQSFRIANQLIKSKITPKKFKEQQKIGVERRDLIHELGLDIERDIK